MVLTRRQICLWPLGAWAMTANWSCREELKPEEPTRLLRLAFGSCNKQDHLQQHWTTIRQQQPEGWLWMGDCIYADEASPVERVREYKKLSENSEYRALADSGFVLGTWDDHDYGSNDAGMEYEHREASQQIFLDFLGEASDSPRRLRPGLYGSRDIGLSETQVQFILLDMRFFKPQAALQADPLGDAQWQWLESEVTRPGPALKVLVSSLQCLTPFTGKETWAGFPEAQARLLQLLASSPVQVLILSGDRHLSEIATLQLGGGRTLYEMTASGLTHTTELKNENPWRLGEQINATNFGMLTLNWEDSPSTLLKSLHLRALSPQDGQLLQELHVENLWTPVDGTTGVR